MTGLQERPVQEAGKEAAKDLKASRRKTPGTRVRGRRRMIPGREPEPPESRHRPPTHRQGRCLHFSDTSPLLRGTTAMHFPCNHPFLPRLSSWLGGRRAGRHSLPGSRAQQPAAAKAGGELARTGLRSLPPQMPPGPAEEQQKKQQRMQKIQQLTFDRRPSLDSQGVGHSS